MAALAAIFFASARRLFRTTCGGANLMAALAAIFFASARRLFRTTCGGANLVAALAAIFFVRTYRLFKPGTGTFGASPPAACGSFINIVGTTSAMFSNKKIYGLYQFLMPSSLAQMAIKNRTACTAFDPIRNKAHPAAAALALQAGQAR